MNYEELIKERYSVRNFKEDKIERKKLDKILEAGRIAPTASNAQPQKIYVLESEDAFKKLGVADKMRYGAPVVLMVCADINKAWKNLLEKYYNSAEMDASIVCTHMMLEAWNLGIGSVWIRFFNSNELQKNFGLDKNIRPICLLPLGYKTDDCKASDRHFMRKDITDIVEYL